MYARILVGLDGSAHSDLAGDAALSLAKSLGSGVIACHVYAAAMHRARFSEMEIGLPDRYQEQDKLEHLRDTHEDIISGGMKMISDAYLTPFVDRASEMGLAVKGETPEGKNYTQFLNVMRDSAAGLTVVGAEGQGKVPETTLGSFAERTLLLAKDSDVLIIRKRLILKNRPIVVGVDGSEHSYLALRRAVRIAERTGASVRAVAVYDPFFHTGVFSSISTALSKEQAGRFNFSAQERLHDEIIDDGLRSLYDSRIEKGLKLLEPTKVDIRKEILTGKVFAQLSHYASTINAGLIVVGRSGTNHDGPAMIGSTPSTLARIASTNLLVVDLSEARRTDDAIVQPQDSSVKSEPATPLLRPRPLESTANAAELVVLRKAKKMAPAFHEHIARARIVGQEIEAGTRFMVFDIVETSPKGKVAVTPQTRLEFVK